jgi:hypothetical protein
VKILHISCAEEVSAPFIKLVGSKEIYYAFLSSSGGTMKKHVHILPLPGTVTEWRECTPESIVSVEDVEPDKSWNTKWMFVMVLEVHTWNTCIF